MLIIYQNRWSATKVVRLYHVAVESADPDMIVISLGGTAPAPTLMCEFNSKGRLYGHDSFLSDLDSRVSAARHQIAYGLPEN